MTVPLHQLSHHPVFVPLQFAGTLALKAGILPYRYGKRGCVFLVAAPLPIRDPNDSVPFAIARGSRRVRMQSGDWQDARSPAELAVASQIEPAQQTALREGEEELGLPASMVCALYDCGILAYKEYGIHMFLAEVEAAVELLSARDSADTCWVTLEQARAMAVAGEFNAGYLPLLEALAAACEQRAAYRL